jgi:hypothetical protein
MQFVEIKRLQKLTEDSEDLLCLLLVVKDEEVKIIRSNLHFLF